MTQIDVEDIAGRFRGASEYLAPLFGLENEFDYKIRLVPRDAEAVERELNFKMIRFVGDFGPDDGKSMVSVEHYYKGSLIESGFVGKIQFPFFHTGLITGRVLYNYVKPTILSEMREFFKGFIYHGSSRVSLDGYFTLISVVSSCAGFAYAARGEEQPEILIQDAQRLATREPVVTPTDLSPADKFVSTMDQDNFLSTRLAYVLFCREGPEIIPALVHLKFKEAHRRIQKLTGIDIKNVDQKKLENLVERRAES